MGMQSQGIIAPPPPKPFLKNRIHEWTRGLLPPKGTREGSLAFVGHFSASPSLPEPTDYHRKPFGSWHWPLMRSLIYLTAVPRSATFQWVEWQPNHYTNNLKSYRTGRRAERPKLTPQLRVQFSARFLSPSRRHAQRRKGHPLIGHPLPGSAIHKDLGRPSGPEAPCRAGALFGVFKGKLLGHRQRRGPHKKDTGTNKCEIATSPGERFQQRTSVCCVHIDLLASSIRQHAPPT